jgi:hypothetical protein
VIAGMGATTGRGSFLPAAPLNLAVSFVLGTPEIPEPALWLPLPAPDLSPF